MSDSAGAGAPPSGGNPRCLERDGPDFPTLLRAISDPPRHLWVRGRLDGAPCVAIVGARACSSYGRSVAEGLGAALAARGITIVSGLARGIDAAAHRGALRAGTTVAVLPNGIRRVYPAGHRALAAAIARNGALIAEFDTDEPPARWHFPRRNRIIAGLSHCVVVVEAGENSGARITADLALDYDRDVLVVPGNITSPASRGCNALIAEGARPCTGPDDVVDALPEAVRAGLTPAPGGAPADLDDTAMRLLRRCRRHGAQPIARLAADLELGLPALLAAVSELEALRLATVLPGNLVEALSEGRWSGPAQEGDLP